MIQGTRASILGLELGCIEWDPKGDMATWPCDEQRLASVKSPMGVSLD